MSFRADTPWKANLFPVLVFLGLVVTSGILEVSANGYVQRILLYVLANSILAISLNLVSGFTGQFSMGHAGFAAIGGYLAAWMSLQPWEAQFRAAMGSADFLVFGIEAIAGGLLAACFGLLVGIPSLRLRGDYLAIVTLGFGEIVRVVAQNIPEIGGALGLSQLPVPSAFQIGPFHVSQFMALFSYMSFWAVLSFFVIWRITQSVHGKVLMSVREDELASEAMGVSTTRAKVFAFVLSSFFAGVAGSLSALAVGGLNPTVASFSRSVDIIIMVVFGGLGSLTGSIIAAFVITTVPEFVLREIQDQTGVDLRMVIYSLLLIIFMIVRPKGMLGSEEIGEFVRRKLGRKELA